MPYNSIIHHRRSIRLRGYDYARPGAYFVTLCAKNRECLFGKIVEGKMQLNEMGRIVASCWEWLAEQYGYVELDEWVVMPNHLHGIIVVNSGDAAAGRGASRRAPTKPQHVMSIPNKIKPLGQLIGAFKIVSTPRINEFRGTPGMGIWQRNYHEHIIRDIDELNRIRAYITANPEQWDFDRENPSSKR